MSRKIVLCGGVATMYSYAQEVVKELREAGFDAAIAGGFVRDIVFAQAPKDVDIVVPVGTGDEDHVEALVKLAMKRICPSPQWRWFPFYGEREIGDRIFSVLQRSDPYGPSIDILLYRAESIPEAANAFDDTLNMLTLSPEGRVQSHSPKVIRLGEMDSHRPLTTERIAKMKAKHKAIRESMEGGPDEIHVFTPSYFNSFTVEMEDITQCLTKSPIPF